MGTSPLQLLPYQRQWVADSSPLKIVVKARQIGYSFAATLRAVLACLARKTTWILLSKGERQSRLLMEKVAEHVRSCGAVARALESTYFEGTLTKQLETRFPNGSVIYGLPANPDTARGYSGHVTLDEFAFHADADKIYSALFPTITRGFGLEVISTPNGTQGKFYELAKAAGLVERKSEVGNEKQERKWEVGNRKSGPTSDFLLPISGLLSPLPTSYSRSSASWSAHLCDIYEAVRQGLRIDIKLLRSGCEDESAWQQEFCCEFVSTAENFFSPELLAACLSAEASSDTPPHLLVPHMAGSPTLRAISAPGDSREPENRNSKLENRDPNFEFRVSSFENSHSEFYLGIDVGRRHDRTVFWLDEVMPQQKTEIRNSKLETTATNFDFRVSSFGVNGRLSVTRMVRSFMNTPFSEQLAYARELLSLREGSGAPLISRVAIDATGIGLPLAESLAQEFGPRVEPVVFTAAVKEDLAFRTRRRMEDRLTLLPDTREVRQAFSAVKKFVTPSGNLRFDAARTEAGHSDEFWAKALADYAADLRPSSSPSSDGFLADGAPIINPRAFAVVEPGWAGLL